MNSNPASKIIEKFGGAYALSRALIQLKDPAARRSPSVIFRWTYPKSKGGTGGLIPNSAVSAVKKAARLEGIMLTAEDFYNADMY